MRNQSVITGESICYSYTRERTILKDISFEFRSGEIVSILGPNGAGKTTFLNCLANLVPLDSGAVYLNGKNIRKMPPREVAKIIGYVPQIIVPSFDFSVVENVVTGCAPHMGTLSRPKQEHYDIAMEAIRRMGIENLANRSYSQISGGERPQVYIARALSQRPAFILMDAPTAHLDYGNQIKVLKTVRSLKEEGYGVILTTHNPDHALLLQDQVAILDRSGVLSTGLSTDVLKERELSKLYGTELKLFYQDSLGREVCAAPQFD